MLPGFRIYCNWRTRKNILGSLAPGLGKVCEVVVAGAAAAGSVTPRSAGKELSCLEYWME